MDAFLKKLDSEVELLSHEYETLLAEIKATSTADNKTTGCDTVSVLEQAASDVSCRLFQSQSRQLKSHVKKINAISSGSFHRHSTITFDEQQNNFSDCLNTVDELVRQTDWRTESGQDCPKQCIGNEKVINSISELYINSNSGDELLYLLTEHLSNLKDDLDKVELPILTYQKSNSDDVDNALCTFKCEVVKTLLDCRKVEAEMKHFVSDSQLTDLRCSYLEQLQLGGLTPEEANTVYESQLDAFVMEKSLIFTRQFVNDLEKDTSVLQSRLETMGIEKHQLSRLRQDMKDNWNCIATLIKHSFKQSKRLMDQRTDGLAFVKKRFLNIDVDLASLRNLSSEWSFCLASLKGVTPFEICQPDAKQSLLLASNVFRSETATSLPTEVDLLMKSPSGILSNIRQSYSDSLLQPDFKKVSDMLHRLSQQLVECGESDKNIQSVKVSRSTKTQTLSARKMALIRKAIRDLSIQLLHLESKPALSLLK